MRVWKDIEGTIPAKVGDKVARIGDCALPEGATLSQNEVDNQPVLVYHAMLTNDEFRQVQDAIEQELDFRDSFRPAPDRRSGDE